MPSWGHCTFRKLLLDKTRKYPSCLVYLVNEAYTQNLRVLGTINNMLRSSETFICPNCKSRFNRDINAARNILLRYLTTSEINGSNIVDGQRLL